MKWGWKDYNGMIIWIYGMFYLIFSMYVLYSDVLSIKLLVNKYEFNVIFFYLCRVYFIFIWLYVL